MGSSSPRLPASGAPPIRGLAEAGAYLEGLINLERLPDFPRERLDLGPIRELLAALGHPERQLCVLHLAGSKGKGSTSLIAESILTAAGERVGTFTSPHLERWTERFRVSGREVAGEVLAEVVGRLRPHVDRMRREARLSPSFFDATTAAGILLFCDQAVDRAILEVGLGGRLDSTNAVPSAVTCITSIELEHTDKLGNSLAEIAAEKAGIIKPGVPCVMGRLADEAARVVRESARRVGAPLFELGRDFDYQADTRGRIAEPLRVCFEARDGFSASGWIAALGEHQTANAALAIAAVRLLRHTQAGTAPQAAGRGGVDREVADRGTAAAVAEGLQRAHLPGRIEVLGKRPWLIVDSAHTAASARALAGALQPLSARRRHLVLSISAGKDLTAILDALVPGAEQITLTRAEANRSLPPEELAAVVRDMATGAKVSCVPDPEQAVRGAWERLAPDDLLCVAGSVYLAGIARATLRAPHANASAGEAAAPSSAKRS